MKLSVSEIARAVGGTVIYGDPEVQVESITTDSHIMKGADLFVPIKGARVDGHRFICSAAAAGAAASFTAYRIEELRELCGQEPFPKALILTGDTRKALQDLGRYYREHYVPIPYIGVTGSVGKTTVREMTACALSAGLRVYSTKGNANSQTGVPITVTETDPEAQIGVIEMGISEFGEMGRLTGIVQCDTAIVTVIGVSHIGNLGTQENIMREKLLISEGMKKGGTLLLNGDDPLLSRADIRDFLPENVSEKGIRILYYGTGENADFRAVGIKSSGGCAAYDLMIGDRKAADVSLGVPGNHMVLNSLAALSAACCHGVDPQKAADALSEFRSLDGRGRVFEKNGITVINDAYNAAPQSMTAGLQILNDAEVSGRRIAVLADMLELGPDEDRYHREVGTFLAEKTPRIHTVMLYGKLAAFIGDGIAKAAGAGTGPEILRFSEMDELINRLQKELSAGDAVLFKGSNSMKLGALVKELFGQ